MWPEGVVGSITHSTGRCVAAVGFADEWCGVGIDVERVDADAADLLPIIASDSEMARPSTLPTAHLATVLFSAKEAAFKALTGQWVSTPEFDDIDVLLEESTGVFRAQVLTAAPRMPSALEGRFSLRDGWVRTAVSLASVAEQKDEYEMA
jgi:4'-phosphopantetheinyl transferase EntD